MRPSTWSWTTTPPERSAAGLPVLTCLWEVMISAPGPSETGAPAVYVMTSSRLRLAPEGAERVNRVSCPRAVEVEAGGADVAFVSCSHLTLRGHSRWSVVPRSPAVRDGRARRRHSRGSISA